MKQGIVFLLIALGVYACGQAGDEAGETVTGVAAGEKKIDGEKIYKQYCITCHGLYGDMGASGAFDLSASQLSIEERVLVITNGRNLMTPFKSLLSEEKIKAVAEYTLTLADKKKNR
jgi:mono/diheme cytochrome c family protein